MAAPAFSVPNQNAARLADPALRQALLKFARRRLPPGEVEDLVQNTLTEALVSAHAPSDGAEFQRWVHGIARHKIADSYRRRGREPILGADVDAKAGDAGTGAGPGELAEWIESELPKTEGAHKTLHWLLRENDGESLDEIARDAALPAPRVRQRVSRLRRHFHARWLALGAAGLLLLLVAGLLLHGARRPSVAPPIARELPPSESSGKPAAQQARPAPSAPAVAPELEKGPTPKQLAPKKPQPKQRHDKPKKATQKLLMKSAPQANGAPLSKSMPASKSAPASKESVFDGNAIDSGAARKP